MYHTLEHAISDEFQPTLQVAPLHYIFAGMIGCFVFQGSRRYSRRAVRWHTDGDVNYGSCPPQTKDRPRNCISEALIFDFPVFHHE